MLYKGKKKRKKENNRIAGEKSYVYIKLSYFHSKGQKNHFYHLQIAKNVGLDGISYNILNEVPEQWRHKLLHSFLQKRWETGLISSIWKSSIKMPIRKQEKSRTEINSY